VGVSTYLALTFGTLLSSQGTDASFKTVSRVSPDVCPFGVSDSIRSVSRPVSGAVLPNQIPLSAGRLPAGLYFRAFPLRLQIEPAAEEIRHAEETPAKGERALEVVPAGVAKRVAAKPGRLCGNPMNLTDG
ncbi:hypothetical protein DTL70_12500, partial [Streptomyces diacarni]